MINESNLYKAVIHLLEMIFTINNGKKERKKVDVKTINSDLNAIYFGRHEDFKTYHPLLTESVFINREIEKAKSYLATVKEKNDYYERILLEWISFLELKINVSISINPTPTKIEDQIIKETLIKLGLFELKKTSTFSDTQKERLISLIYTQELPYIIALFDYVEFIKHLQKTHFTSKEKMFSELAKILNTTNRMVKGNINVLNAGSKEDRNRYTSHNHTEIIKEDLLKIASIT